jgi:hypothetical protein
LDGSRRRRGLGRLAPPPPAEVLPWATGGRSGSLTAEQSSARCSLVRLISPWRSSAAIVGSMTAARRLPQQRSSVAQSLRRAGSSSAV